LGELGTTPGPHAQGQQTSTSATSPNLPTPLISRNAPAYATSTYNPASYADDASYDTEWRSTSTPAWLAYDLSEVPTSKRDTVLVAWYNSSYEYDNTVVKMDAYNCPEDYTIQVNAAPGGARPPADGWITRVTITGNTKHSRQHLIDMRGYNWIRLNATAVDGTTYNYDISLNMDIFDATQEIADDWIFYGDSITTGAMTRPTIDGVPDFSQLINASRPNRFPVQEDGGIPFLTSADGSRLLSTWLSVFPGTYVGLSYGTNDASGCVNPQAFYASYVSMVQTVLRAGKIPIVPHIPWGRLANIQRCAPTLNAQIDRLYVAFPRVVKGPDLWAFYQAHQGLISQDGVHPSGAGFAAYRQQWASQMLASVYRASA
jgi:lysophospholipase L1-like esterase